MKANPRIRPAASEAAVLTAFFAARDAGRPSIDCYKAGVDVWKCLHPDHAPAYAARCAVGVILNRIQDRMMDVGAGVLDGYPQRE